LNLSPPDKTVERRAIAYYKLAHPRLTMAYDNLAHPRLTITYDNLAHPRLTMAYDNLAHKSLTMAHDNKIFPESKIYLGRFSSGVQEFSGVQDLSWTSIFKQAD